MITSQNEITKIKSWDDRLQPLVDQIGLLAPEAATRQLWRTQVDDELEAFITSLQGQASYHSGDIGGEKWQAPPLLDQSTPLATLANAVSDAASGVLSFENSNSAAC